MYFFIASAGEHDAASGAMSAADSSFRNTMIIEVEFVRKSRNVSAGRFRERWEDTEMIKLLRVRRQLLGNLSSEGSIGPYHHLQGKISSSVLGVRDMGLT